MTNIAAELKAGNTVISFTKGSSMHPLLYEGKTYVVISPIRGRLVAGDLPLYRRADGKYVLHRLVRVEGGVCYTRGDNCIGMEKVPEKKMLGIVTEIGRNGRIIRVTDPGYRRYVRFWLWSAPVRISLYRLREKVRNLCHRMRKCFRRG